MNRSVFGASVQGASHKRKGMPCQDNYAIRNNSFAYPKASVKNSYYAGLGDDICIIAVADGHGSDSCPYSKTGSQIAVNVFCDIMAEFCFKFRDDMATLTRQLRSESDVIHVAQAIEIDWKKRARSNYILNKSRRDSVLNEEDEDEYAIYKLYGTTLLGMLITESFVFSFQIGDGDITFVNESSVYPMLEQEKILGVETHSLAKKSAWTHSISKLTMLNRYQELPMMFVLSTDGMVNSFISENEFRKSCQEYLSMIRDHGANVIESNLPKWLNETSEQGCGDDTTVVFAYFD